MKKTAISISIVIAGLFVIWYVFIYSPSKFNTKPYEAKIKSLEQKVDSITKQNDSLDYIILEAEKNNTLLAGKNSDLIHKVEVLKNSRKKNSYIKYTPTQIDSFFKARYSLKYLKVSKDTTKLPIEVSKSIVLDLKESDINKDIIINQDTLISNLQLISKNKDEIISDFKAKDYNYEFIIKNKSQQIDNYKLQITGLKEDSNKIRRKLRVSKIEKFILLAGVGFFILHK